MKYHLQFITPGLYDTSEHDTDTLAQALYESMEKSSDGPDGWVFAFAVTRDREPLTHAELAEVLADMAAIRRAYA